MAELQPIAAIPKPGRKRSGPACSVCTHPKREAIDEALALDRITIRGAAAAYGVDRSSIAKHRNGHLPARLVAAARDAEFTTADHLLGLLAEAITELKEIIDENRALEPGVAIRGYDSRLRHLELLAKVAGQLTERITISLDASPEWQMLQVSIMAALEPHPDARAAVVAALEATP